MSPAANRQVPSPARLIGLLVLALQVLGALALLVLEPRLFHLTPYAGATAYRLNVSIDGAALGDAQIQARYGLPFRGETSLTAEGIQRIILAREGGEKSGSPAVVRLHFSSQGGSEHIWLWPQQ